MKPFDIMTVNIIRPEILHLYLGPGRLIYDNVNRNLEYIDRAIGGEHYGVHGNIRENLEELAWSIVKHEIAFKTDDAFTALAVSNCISLGVGPYGNREWFRITDGDLHKIIIAQIPLDDFLLKFMQAVYLQLVT